MVSIPKIAIFLYIMTILKGGTHADGIKKIKSDFLTIFASAMCVKPITNILIFKYIPIYMQVVVGSTFGVFWGNNLYILFLNFN